jgi:serine/threonine protein phosphatase PrpC
MRVDSLVRAAGNTHPGLLRASNEDRFHYDATRGLFIVIDGVGGHSAGEEAADAALATIRARLERAGGRVEDRIREAITRANNEVHRLASLRPEWKGMACVLTLALLDNGDAVVGHVGDTRLYKLRGGHIEKLTHDHSPVGEREDAGELSERDAMRHPRRNEVYRDVGSEPHDPSDEDFIDVFRVPFEPDAALLLCSDGLTDSVETAAINRIVQEYAGHAYEIVRALIDAANAAGGKDNVTIVYVEGSRFADGEDTRDVRRRAPPPAAGTPASHASQNLPARLRLSREEPSDEPRRGLAEAPGVQRREGWGRLRLAALVGALVVTLALAAYLSRDRWLPVIPFPLPPAVEREVVVAPGGSITAAMESAAPGTRIVLEPGEYRERLILTNGARIRSRVSRGASIRMPAGAAESDAAVLAVDIVDAELTGLRIVGDVAAPLGTGVRQRNAELTLVDVEVTGARHAALEFETGATGTVLASALRDNPGLAVIVRAGAAPRIGYSEFARNSTSGRAAGPLVVEAGGRIDLRRNVFYGTTFESLILPPGGSGAIASENWFIAAAPDRVPPQASPRGRRSR